MGIVDRVRSRYEVLMTPSPEAMGKAQANAATPEWLSATGGVYAQDILYTPERQNRLYASLSWIQMAISMIAQTATTSKIDIKHQALVDDDEEDIKNHAFETLLQRPNPHMSRSEFIAATVSFYILSGNAYWWLNQATENAVPDELWVIPPSKLRPLADGNLYIRGYMYDPGDGHEIFIPREEIVHFKKFNPSNPYLGLSAVESIYVVATGDLAMQNWNTNLFDKDNAKVPGALAFAEYIDDSAWAKMKQETKEQHGGTKRSMMMLRNVGAGGVQWLNMSMSQREMEFLSGRRFNRDEIFNIIAPGLVSVLSENATQANAIAGKQTLIEYSVWPHLVNIAEKITTDLLPRYGEGLRAEFEDIRVTDRALALSEEAAYSTTHTVDEIRQKFHNDKPIGDARGKLFISQITPASGLEPEPEAASEALGDDVVLDGQPTASSAAQPEEADSIPDVEAPGVDTPALDPTSAADTGLAKRASKAASLKLHTSIMVAFFLPLDIVDAVVQAQSYLPRNAEATPADELHLTLAMLGDTTSSTDDTAQAIIDALDEYSLVAPPIAGILSGIGRFKAVDGPGVDCIYASFDSKDLVDWRAGLMFALAARGVASPSEHGFTPHITLGYVPADSITPMIALPSKKIKFEDIWLALGEGRRRFPLEGTQGGPAALPETPVPVLFSDEVKRLKKWLKKRKSPDLSKFDSAILSDAQKLGVWQMVSSEVVDVSQGVGSRQPFFLVTGGKATPNLPGKDGNDKQRLALEDKHAGLLAAALRKLASACLPTSEGEATADAIIKKYRAAQKELLLPVVRNMLTDGAAMGATMGRAQVEHVTPRKKATPPKDKPKPGDKDKPKPKKPVGVDWGLVNDDVVDWVEGGEDSDGYDTTLLDAVGESSEEAIRGYLTNWIDSGDPLGDLVDALSDNLFSETRASAIATTEVTRAYATGNRLAWQSSDVITGMRWQTANDDRVCPICGPLDQETASLDDGFGDDGIIPPAHPNCRCWITPYIEDGGDDEEDDE